MYQVLKTLRHNRDGDDRKRTRHFTLVTSTHALSRTALVLQDTLFLKEQHKSMTIIAIYLQCCQRKDCVG